MRYILFLILGILCGCSYKANEQNSEVLTSVQIIDRNGFSETISVKSRLANYEKVNFLDPQPYKKVMRVFGKTKSGLTAAKITSYHSNGQLWEYLEVHNGRAYGNYKEWHPNGKLKLHSYVIEGIADISEKAKMSWIFDGKSIAFDEEGHLIAEIFYDKGALEGNSLYYHPNGQLSKIIPYHHNKVEGTIQIFDNMGMPLEKIPYKNDLKQGTAEGFWDADSVKYREDYDHDLLNNGVYYRKDGSPVAEIKNGHGKQAFFEEGYLYSLAEYEQGLQQGKVEIFDKEGFPINVYHVLEGKKQGEEWEYYPHSNQPKLYLNWNDDQIQGMVKTWYASGALQSEREIHANKKHGLSFAWYEEGQLMLMEEYENDMLLKGNYYKKGDKLPVSKIEEGKGIATLYDSKGHFLRKIPYEKGKPTLDP